VIRFALLALLALGCAGGGGDAPIDGGIDGVIAPPVAVWLTAEHPAAAAQARWGLPIPCVGLQVRELARAELQQACDATAADGDVLGCIRPASCEIVLAAGLETTRRQVVLTHELGHLLRPRAGHVHAGCPADGAGEHLMCEQGPSSGSPDPTPADFDLVLGGAS
jgi:hypothetical protein